MDDKKDKDSKLRIEPKDKVKETKEVKEGSKETTLPVIQPTRLIFPCIKGDKNYTLDGKTVIVGSDTYYRDIIDIADIPKEERDYLLARYARLEGVMISLHNINISTMKLINS